MRAIELAFRVEVLGWEAHLLQCDLDGSGSASVVLGKFVRRNQILSQMEQTQTAERASTSTEARQIDQPKKGGADGP